MTSQQPSPPLRLEPLPATKGVLHLPGSKSLSNRALLLAALCQGTTALDNLLFSQDTTHMLKALEVLGVELEDLGSDYQAKVKGNGFDLSHLPEGVTEIFLGNAGTAMRPLCAALALGLKKPGVTLHLLGEPRMYERPIGPLVNSLEALGCRVDYLGQDGFPPLAISAPQLESPLPTQLQIDGSLSSQYVTALLIALPLLKAPISLELTGTVVSQPYIDLTLATLESFGIKWHSSGHQTYSLDQQNSQYQAPASGEFWIEGDASSASYFLAAAALSGGSVTLDGVGSDSLQGDKDFAMVLEEMGARIMWEKQRIHCQGRSKKLLSIDGDFNAIPDAAMTLAPLALFADGPSCLRNIYNWRIKETDRLVAMATELRKVGAEIEEGNDYLKITPPTKPHHASIATYNDHRMAMCFALLAVGGTPVTIEDPGCVAKTFPQFFKEWQRLHPQPVT